MRKARDFVDEYRRKGYPDERIRIIASMRPEPLRSDVLKLLETGDDPADSAPAAEEAAAESIQAPVTSEAPPPAQPAADDTRPSSAAKVAEARTKHADALQKEREKLETELQKQQHALEQLRNENAEVQQLRRQVSDMQSLRKEAEKMREQQEALSAAKTDLEARVVDLESDLVQKDALLSRKDSLLSEKQEALAETEASLAKEQGVRQAATRRSDELAATVEEQGEQLEAFDALNRKIADSAAALDQMREEAAELAESDRAKAKRVEALEADASHVQQQADELRQQIASNEQAVDGLQEKLTSRESELESLRAHFDLEAKDLKKRAEQEVRMIQRRIRRVRRLAALGSGIAACVLLLLFVGYVGKTRTASDLRQENAGLRDRDAGHLAGTQLPRAPDVTPAVHEGLDVPSAPSARRSRPGVLPLVTPSGGAPAMVEPATDDQPPESARPATRTIIYTVKKGDKLWDISKRFLKDGTKWRSIARENGISIHDARRVKPGMKLKITVPAED